MTHDELLEKINEEIQPCGTETHFKCKSLEENLPWKALRAVVELHKPIWTFPEGSNNSIPICLQCRDGEFESDYPCPTIQAIEKELK